MNSHEVDYEIIGEGSQMVIVELDPGETVIAEAGAMTYMETGIEFETKMGDGSKPDQGFLGKVKRFADTEGTIVDFEELMHNENEAEINELGYQERSSAQAGQVPGNTLGALEVSHPDWEETFGIGTGFTANERFTLWQNRDKLKGCSVKFKHQPSGAKDKPRFPVYLGLRKD